MSTQSPSSLTPPSTTGAWRVGTGVGGHGGGYRCGTACRVGTGVGGRGG